MSIDATSGQKNTVTQPKKPSFFKKIGNWFNKNGNTVGNVMSAVGDTAMSTGMTLAQFEVMRKGSIWGMGFMGCGMPLGCGMDFYSNCDPLGVSGWMGYGTGGYNPYLTQMGNQMAFNWGAITMQQMMAQQQLQANQYSQFNLNQNTNQNINVNQKIKADFAELDVSKQDTKDGKLFDDATNELVDKDGKAVKDKSFDLCVKKGDTDAETASNYKTRVSELGKSYIAHIESKSSDGIDNDGIDLKEFKEHELAKLSSNADDEKKAQAEKYAESAFGRLDINGDGKIDWKEYSSAIMTFDQKYGKPTKNSNDGKITSEDYEKWSVQLPDKNQNLFDVSIRENYKNLFKEDDSE